MMNNTPTETEAKGFSRRWTYRTEIISKIDILIHQFPIIIITKPTWIWTTIQIQSDWNRIDFSCRILPFPLSPRPDIGSRRFSFPCRSKLSKFMTNLSFSDLATNKSFSVINLYKAINKFWQNGRSTWPNFPARKILPLAPHFRQKSINKTALPYRSSWHKLISASPHYCSKSSFGGLSPRWHRRSTSFRASFTSSMGMIHRIHSHTPNNGASA